MNKYTVLVMWSVSGGVVVSRLTIEATSMAKATLIAESYEQVTEVKGVTLDG